MLVVGPQVPVRTVPDFVAWAKRQPAGVNYASWGVGSSSQVRALQLAQAIGVPMNHVPYCGNPDAIQSLLADEIPMMFSGLVAAAPHHKAGKLRMLAFTGTERSPFFTDIPTFKEVGLPTIVAADQNLHQFGRPEHACSSPSVFFRRSSLTRLLRA